MILLWQGLVSIYKWQEPDWCTYPSWTGPSDTTSSGLVSGIYGKFQLSIGLRMIWCQKYSFNSCFSTWSRQLFLNSVPLSDSIYLGHMWTGRYWLMTVDIIVSADLAGIQKASGHPERWWIMVRIYLFPELEVSHSVMRSVAILSNGLSGISVIWKG